MEGLRGAAFNTAQTVYQNLPSARQVANNIAKVNRAAIPIMGTLLLLELTGADAGPAAFAECMAACLPMMPGPLKIGCCLVCGPFLATPTP